MQKPNLIFMYGEDSFSLAKELDRWKKGFVQKHGENNLEVLDGKKVSGAEVSSLISVAPFLAEKRLIILKNFLKEKKADDRKALIPVLELLSSDTILVIAEDNAPDKRSGLYKKLVKIATLKPFELKKGYELSQWIMSQGRKHGAEIHQYEADYLARNSSNNPWDLDNEIQKLALYAKGTRISQQMIDQLVSGSMEQSIFTLTDQLAQKKHSGALKTMHGLLEQGQEAPFLFSMIARQFRLMLEMKALSEEGVPSSQIASKMKVHPFVVKKTLPMCRNFTKPQLRTILSELLKIDERLKTGGLHMRTREAEQYLLAIERVLLIT